MGPTEVVHYTHPEHGRIQVRRLARGRPTPSGQGGQPGSKRRVQPFDGGRVDHAQADLTGLPDRFRCLQAAVRQPTPHRSHAPLGVLFDDLDNVQICPDDQGWPPAFATPLRIAKHPQDRLGPCREPIHRPQDRLAHARGGPHVLDHLRDQRRVARGRDRAPHEQAREDRHGSGQRDRAILSFDIQLVALDLAEVDLPLADDLVLDLLSVPTGFEMPIGDRALVQPKGEDNRRDRAAMGEQGQDDHDQPGRMFESEQWGADRFRERLATSVADVAAFFVRMDADVIACATSGVGAYCQLRAQWRKGCTEHTSQIPSLHPSVNLTPRAPAVLPRVYEALFTDLF